MIRYPVVYTILATLALGAVIAGYERALPQPVPAPTQTPTSKTPLTRAAAPAPIAEFDLAGRRRAKPCPTMGALEALPAKGATPSAEEGRCVKIPAIFNPHPRRKSRHRHF
jgi:hypothetical protein